MLVGDIPANNAVRAPRKAAVLLEDRERRTYAELEHRVSRLRSVLRKLDVHHGDRVALLSRNRIECVETLFACAGVGAIYAPLSFDLRGPALGSTLEELAPSLLIAHPEFRLALGRPACPVLWLEEDFEERIRENQPDADCSVGVEEHDVCWISHTGGTTGQPKGVMLTHRNVFANALNLTLLDQVAGDDVYMVTGSLFHIVLNMGLAYWIAGATVVIQDFEPAKCLDLIGRHRVTKFVPAATALALLTEEQARSPRDVSSLRRIGLGGGMIPAVMVRQALDAFGCEFSQTYGQTEAAHHFAALSAQDYRRGLSPGATTSEVARLASAGLPQPLCSVRILDGEGRPLQPLELGEIAARGANVMKGYWRRPELTANVLRDEWLLTGDLGFVDRDGYLYVVDRKEMTFRATGGAVVYPAQTERALFSHPLVLECAAFAASGVLHAVVVPRSGRKPDPAELVAFCRERLPAHQVPACVRITDSLPRAPTGKIARHRLAAWREATGGTPGGRWQLSLPTH
jgi:fatty-acyl-CoA synthase